MCFFLWPLTTWPGKTPESFAFPQSFILKILIVPIVLGTTDQKAQTPHLRAPLMAVEELGVRCIVKNTASGADCLDSHPSSTSSWLRDRGRVA